MPISPKQKKKINREWWKRAQQQIPTAWPLRVNPGREEGEKKNPKDPSVPLLHDAAAACAIPFFLSPQLRSPSPHLASPLFPCGAPLARRPGGASFRRRAAGRKSPREGEGISTGAADRQPGGGWGRMVSLSTWFRYAAHKFEYSISLTWKVLTDTFISLPPHASSHSSTLALDPCMLVLVFILPFSLVTCPLSAFLSVICRFCSIHLPLTETLLQTSILSRGDEQLDQP